MFIPIRTDRPPRRKPLITEGLIVVNLLVYLAGLIAQSLNWFDLDALVSWGHFDPQRFRLWQLVTSLFLHDPRDIWHLAFNMLFLWVFGAAVEDRFTRIGFFIFYIAGGAFASLGHAMVSSSPVIGASGAISAVAGAYLALFPRSRIIVLVLFFVIGVLHVPSMWFILFYFVLDVLQQTGDLLGAGGSKVAYMAHIAGYVFGFAVAFTLLATKALKREEYDIFFLFTQSRRRAAHRAAGRSQAAGMWESATADTGARLEQSKKATQSNPEQERLGQIRAEVNRLAAANDLPAAAATYRNLLRAAPDTVFGEQRQLELANQLYANHDHAHAAAAYELLLDRYPRCSNAAEVRLILGVLYTRQLQHPARAREVIESARPALRDPRQAALADELLAELKA